MRVMLHLYVQAGQVEAVEDIILFDLAKVLVSLVGKEPRYPLL